jgi:hypothetical protein
MAVVGAVLAFGMALVGAVLTALLLASGWNALREEILPGFRIESPGLRSLALVLIGLLLPVGLLAVFSGYFAVEALSLLFARAER